MNNQNGQKLIFYNTFLGINYLFVKELPFTRLATILVILMDTTGAVELTFFLITTAMDCY